MSARPVPARPPTGDARASAAHWSDAVAAAGRNIGRLAERPEARWARAGRVGGPAFAGRTAALAREADRTLGRLWADFLAAEAVTSEASGLAGRLVDTGPRLAALLEGPAIPAAAEEADGSALLAGAGRRSGRTLAETLDGMARDFETVRTALDALRHAVEEGAPSVAALRAEAKGLRPWLDEIGRTLVAGLDAHAADPVSLAAALPRLRQVVEAARAARDAAARAPTPAYPAPAHPDPTAKAPVPPAPAARAKPEPEPVAARLAARVAAGRALLARAMPGDADLASWLDRIAEALAQGRSAGAAVGLDRWEAAALASEADADAVSAPADDATALAGLVGALRARARAAGAEGATEAARQAAKAALAGSDEARARAAVKDYERAVRAAVAQAGAIGAAARGGTR